MKNIHIVKTTILLLFIMVSAANSFADEVPCIVLSGASEKNINIELAKYNRIYFNENSVTVSSTSDENLKDIELLYSLFNHLEFKNAIPSDESSNVSETIANGVNRLRYLDNKSLIIDSEHNTEFVVGVFNPSGTLIVSTRAQANNIISLEHLSSGVYLAIATNEGIKLSIKFVVR